jgi:hypothetical protein
MQENQVELHSIMVYGVTLDNGQKINVLDTPGHEALHTCTARARGAQGTDIAIIVNQRWHDDLLPDQRGYAHASQLVCQSSCNQ